MKCPLGCPSSGQTVVKCLSLPSLHSCGALYIFFAPVPQTSWVCHWSEDHIFVKLPSLRIKSSVHLINIETKQGRSVKSELSSKQKTFKCWQSDLRALWIPVPVQNKKIEDSCPLSKKHWVDLYRQCQEEFGTTGCSSVEGHSAPHAASLTPEQRGTAPPWLLHI